MMVYWKEGKMVEKRISKDPLKDFLPEGFLKTHRDVSQVTVTSFETPLGPMLCASDEEGIYLLDFINPQKLACELFSLSKALKRSLVRGETTITTQVKQELEIYFKGESFLFKTPCHVRGTPFQRKVWETLQKIPVGETWSYLDLAQSIGYPTAYRAVAQANRTNPFVILVPCHRVIYTHGGIGGYGAGIERKKWLLQHEKEKIFSNK